MEQTRWVMVTGAAGGIGRSMVELAAEANERVVAIDLPGTGVTDLVASLGTGHRAFECDIADEAAVVAMFAALDAEGMRVDVLYNNAAVGPVMAATADTGLDFFNRTLSVNLLGLFVLAREAAQRMQPGGVIVNTASLAGVTSNPRRSAYYTSKAAVVSLTRSLACEWAARGIRVAAVAPGYVLTPMVAELERAGSVDLAAVRRRAPMGRMARPDEIARAARFLGSPQARYVTGSVLVVDGGWMSYNQPGDANPAAGPAPEAELKYVPGKGTGRVVVVTGGGKGIGAAVVKRFVGNGDTVIVADRDAEAAKETAASIGKGCEAIALDVTDETQVVELFADLRSRYGKVDVLVNNAAIADNFAPAFEQKSSDLKRVLDVNLSGAFICAREAIRSMEPGGVVINLGSINTFLPFAPRHAYGASKAAIDMLTRCLAAELGPEGLRTATVAPGYIRTPGVAALESAGRIDTLAIRRRIPMGDMGRPEDIADAAFFLASDDASYINGSILYVDGGWTSFGNAGFASQIVDDEA